MRKLMFVLLFIPVAVYGQHDFLELPVSDKYHPENHQLYNLRIKDSSSRDIVISGMKLLLIEYLNDCQRDTSCNIVKIVDFKDKQDMDNYIAQEKQHWPEPVYYILTGGVALFDPPGLYWRIEIVMVTTRTPTFEDFMEYILLMD